MDDEQYGKIPVLWLEHAGKHARFIDHEHAVPNLVLLRYVNQVYGITPNIFYAHMKQLTREKVVERLRLPMKGKGVVYRVGWDVVLTPEQYFRFPAVRTKRLRAQNLFTESTKKLRDYDRHVFPHEFGTLLDELLAALRVDSSGITTKDSSARVEAIFQRFPTIRRALEMFVGRYIQAFTNSDQRDALRLRNREKKSTEFYTVYAKLYNEVMVNSLRTFLASVNGHLICTDCLRSTRVEARDVKFGEMIFFLSVGFEGNKDAFLAGVNPVADMRIENGEATCTRCGITVPVEEAAEPVEKVPSRQTRIVTRPHGYIYECGRCGAELSAESRKCRFCGWTKIVKRKAKPWE